MSSNSDIPLYKRFEAQNRFPVRLCSYTGNNKNTAEKPLLKLWAYTIFYYESVSPSQQQESGEESLA